MSFPKNLMAAVFAALGPWAPFWIALADSSFLPLAQAVDIMVVAQAVLSPAEAYSTAAMAVGGSTLGCFAAYLAARRGGRRVLEKFVSGKRRRELQESFERQGAWPLIVQAMLPLPMPTRLWLIGAGVFGMQPLRFIGAILFARAVRYFGLVFVTLTFGERALLALEERAWLFAGLLLAGAAAWLARKSAPAARLRAAGLRLRESAYNLGHRWNAGGRRVDEQGEQELGKATADHLGTHEKATARAAHGDRWTGLSRPPFAGTPDSDAALQSRLHLLQ
jgi:membrane protein YqaA with SNARE-associated domain